MIFKKEKQIISKTIKNNYLSIKDLWHCWYKISYYRTSKILTQINKDSIRQAEKVSSNKSLYSGTKTGPIFLNKQNVKITKREHAFKGYTCSHNVEVWNSFTMNYDLKIPSQQLKVSV